MTQTISADQWQAERAKSRTGRDANRAGAAWEACLDVTHDYYNRSGIAAILRAPVPTRVLPGTRGHRVCTGKGPYDFFGTLNGGRSISMESKQSSDFQSRLPIVGRHRGAGLAIHQLEALVRCWALGGLACVVWLNGEQRGVCVGGRLGGALEAYRRNERKGIPWDEFTPFESRHMPGGLWIEDWIGAAQGKKSA